MNILIKRTAAGLGMYRTYVPFTACIIFSTGYLTKMEYCMNIPVNKGASGLGTYRTGEMEAEGPGGATSRRVSPELVWQAVVGLPSRAPSVTIKILKLPCL